MANNFAELAFTPTVRRLQSRLGSRSGYAALDAPEAERNTLSANETEFIEARDGFYQASVGANGWPYVQFRGGPAGFLKVLDARTLGYADFRGNRQYISAGNIIDDGRVALILMDYANQRRLKIWGRARVMEAHEVEGGWLDRLEVPNYRARVERAVVIAVEAFDWNCPQHITPRFTEAEVAHLVRTKVDAELALVRATVPATMSATSSDAQVLGDGPLKLAITGIRQLTPRVRAYELRPTEARELPPVLAGAHLAVPVRLADGRLTSRQYSIASDPRRRDAWEIAVQRDETGRGASAAIHASFALGQRLACGLPRNDFELQTDARPAVLIAGGIGITPLAAMARVLIDAVDRRFSLHYAARSAVDMPLGSELRQLLGARLFTYASDRGERLDTRALLGSAPAGATIYVCGPASLIDDVYAAARELGWPATRVRSEVFVGRTLPGDASLIVELRRSGRTVEVGASQSILEAVEAAGIAVSSSCRTGTCGTCATKVLAGTPLHRDQALSPAERDRASLMCICVSRAHPPALTLDL